MATAFRATVMLVVLVGLPAAWVYYGPLPPEAMGVIERTIASAKHSIGWDEQFQTSGWADEAQKTAPRFDASMASASQHLQQQEIPFAIEPKTPAVTDSKFTLASATVPPPKTEPAPKSANVGVSLAKELEPHLSLLRAMNAADYTLENWGGEGRSVSLPLFDFAGQLRRSHASVRSHRRRSAHGRPPSRRRSDRLAERSPRRNDDPTALASPATTVERGCLV